MIAGKQKMNFRRPGFHRLWLLLGFFFICLSASASVTQLNPAILRVADEILRRQVSDGAIPMGVAPSSESKVIPYFANFAADGLVTAYEQSADLRYLSGSKRWIEWYEAHMNADGTVNDYTGTVGKWKSTGDYDSTDSYAATYLNVVLSAYRASPDKTWLTHRLPAVRKALAAIRLTLQPNGLTFAKPGYPVMFLMDNTETARGLRALAEIAQELAASDLARDARSLAGRMEETLARDLWLREAGFYSHALDKTGKPYAFNGKWYPEVMGNLMAIGWLPYSPRNVALFKQLKERFKTEIPSAAKSESDLSRLVWWGIAANGAGDLDFLAELAQRIEAYDLQKPTSSPALLGHACCVLAASQIERATPVARICDHYDVIIAGAGTAGFGAAMQAARLGSTVLLLEETDWIGGQMNAAAVTSMDEGPKHKDRPYVLVRERGIYHEFVNEVTTHYQAKRISPETAYWYSRLGLEPRVGQDILYRMLQTARAHTPALHVLLRATVISVEKQGNAVSGITLRAVTGQGTVIRQIKSRVLIDATEWGDVIPLTGAAYRVGNCTNAAIDHTRAIQDLTWTAVVKQYPNGVPPELLLTNPPPGYDAMHARFLKSLVPGDKSEMSKRPWTFTTFIGYRGMPNSEQPAVRAITRTHLNYNNDYPVQIKDVEDPGFREATCRSAQLRTLQLLYYIQHTLGKSDWSVANDEGYDSPYNRDRVDRWLREQPELEPFRAVLHHFSVMPYARESRRIIGLHTLSAPEIERIPGTPRLFENCVAVGDYPVDLHGSKKADLLELDLETMADAPKEFGDRGMGPFAVPFESFIPVTLDGFLPGEKNISQSRLANGATRLQPSTMLIGQAAGAIAGLAIKHSLQPRELDPVLVQSLLLEAGDTLHLTPFMDVSKAGAEWPAVQLATVRGLLQLTNSNFSPGAALTPADLSFAMKKLFNAAAVLSDPISRAAFANTLRPLMAGQGVRFAPAQEISRANQAVSRLEAAQVFSGFLRERALAAILKQDRDLPWPAIQSASPLRPEDMRTSLDADLKVLIEHGIIASPGYWNTHAVRDATCDGAQVAGLLKKLAQKLKPGSPESQYLEVLTSAAIIGSPTYWKDHAVPGGQCSGEFTASIIERAARQLKN